MASKIKAESAAIRQYVETLKVYSEHGATHEGATETAFSNLLASTAKPHGWTLIPKKKKVVGKKVHIYPDGTLQDVFKLARGYWEAKDTDDDLDAEIQKKIEKKYPLTNTIFEDTRTAVLYQNGVECQRYDLRKPSEVADLLNRFYDYAEPDYLGFDEAIDEFKVRMPELGGELAETIAAAHKKNKKFQVSFIEFFELCQTALNPDIRQDTVDEMLVQHLLTERLFRTIFHDDEFTRRNVIAAEVEKVIDALVSSSFSKKEFLKRLDRFYIAIEQAAETIDDFKDKQDFLNTLYERFFQGYCVKTADTHGIVYTPQPIVDFMCASVEEVLKTEFGLTLGSPQVKILDPCTGTGNFVVNLIRRVPKKNLPRVYETQLFANEVMLLPYYIAALNIERAYYDITGEYKAFEGLCFVDSLDFVHDAQPSLFTKLNTARVERQKQTPITVIIGNPPYNANQENEGDNNPNREYPILDDRIRATYAKGTKATLKNKLYDPYIKFLRWATDRLKGEDGLVCFVTNHSFAIDDPPFDGVRKSLESEFCEIYFIDLNGNVRRNQKLSGTTHNVFGIQTGVGISILIKKRKSGPAKVHLHVLPENSRKEEKYAWLNKTIGYRNVRWKTVRSNVRHDWLVLSGDGEFYSYATMDVLDKQGLFARASTGAKSNRDEIVYGFQRETLGVRIRDHIELYNGDVDRFKRVPTSNLAAFLSKSKVKWSSTLKLHLKRLRYAAYNKELLRNSLYRPYTKMWLYYDDILNDRPGLFRYALPLGNPDATNLTICCTNHSQSAFGVLITDLIANEAIGGRAGTCFPFYVYDPDGNNRRENITDWSLKQFRKQYADKKITKWDIFYYVYGVLHHPGYRSKFADNLKKSLPRIPFAPDFRAFAEAGKELAALHLDYEKLEPHVLQFVTNDKPLSYRVEKMKLSKDTASLRVNDSLTLAGIPPAVYEYRLGNRSALHWIIDQYQASEDKRSGIVSDPNREDDPEYIVRLIGQVVKVSLETVRIVKALPAEYTAPTAA